MMSSKGRKLATRGNVEKALTGNVDDPKAKLQILHEACFAHGITNSWAKAKIARILLPAIFEAGYLLRREDTLPYLREKEGEIAGILDQNGIPMEIQNEDILRDQNILAFFSNHPSELETLYVHLLAPENSGVVLKHSLTYEEGQTGLNPYKRTAQKTNPIPFHRPDRRLKTRNSSQWVLELQEEFERVGRQIINLIDGGTGIFLFDEGTRRAIPTKNPLEAYYRALQQTKICQDQDSIDIALITQNTSMIVNNRAILGVERLGKTSKALLKTLLNPLNTLPILIDVQRFSVGRETPPEEIVSQVQKIRMDCFHAMLQRCLEGVLTRISSQTHGKN